MQQVLIKKFSLRRNGVVYKAGTILELPEAEANALVAGAPKEFEKVSVGVVVNSTTSAKKAERTLKDFTNTELNVGTNVFTENVHFADSLLTLSYRISKTSAEAGTEENEA